MVQWNDSILLMRGHPIFVQPVTVCIILIRQWLRFFINYCVMFVLQGVNTALYDWYRPDELKKAEYCLVESIFNLVSWRIGCISKQTFFTFDSVLSGVGLQSYDRDWR